MRIVAWNIRAGGGKRVGAIASALERWAADVVTLSEFRGTPPSRWLAERLRAAGLVHQRTTADARTPARNALLVASRFPLRRLAPPAIEDLSRLLHVRIAAPGGLSGVRSLHLVSVHVPNRVTGRKYDFLDAACERVRALGSERPGILVGDTNSGKRGIDEQSPAFNLTEEQWFERLAAHGWRDLYRHLHEQRRAYTWYSPNGDNGFRLDQLFATDALCPHFTAMAYRWAGRGRRSGVSDHAAIIADLSLAPR